MPEPAKGFPIKCYKFGKRKNSTKRPNETWFYLDPEGDLVLQTKVCYKDRVDMLKPTLVLAIDRENENPNVGSGEYDSYWFESKCNYAWMRGRYYWISEMTSISRDHWEITLEVDVLATYKEAIQATRAFILYKTGGNRELIDNRLPRRTNGQSTSAQTSFPWTTSANGTLFLTAMGAESVNVYVFKDGLTTVSDVLNNYNDWAEDARRATVGDGIANWSNASSADKDDAGKSFVNAINKLGSSIVQIAKIATDLASNYFKNFMSSDDVLGNVQGIIWYPFNFAISGAVREITLGLYRTGISAPVIDQTKATIHAQVQCATTYIGDIVNYPWLRRVGYSEWRLYIPYVGVINIPNDYMYPNVKLVCDFYLNLLTGVMKTVVATHALTTEGLGRIIATIDSQLGATLQIGGSGISLPNVVGNFGKGLVTSAAAAVTVALTGGTMTPVAATALGVGTAMSTAQSSVNMVAEAFHAPDCVGGNSGGVVLDSKNQISLQHACYEVSDTPGNLSSLVGEPYFKVGNLKNNGYYQCSGASVEIENAYGFEVDLVNQHLNTGFYME